MPTLRLIVRYDGTGLSGWQRQVGVRTVQEEIEKAAAAMTGTAVCVYGAGRTDAGVHALRQVATFYTDKKIPNHGWQLGLTAHLPSEIAVREVREVPDGYNPRRASAGKRYRYLLLRARVRDPLLRHRAWHLHDSLDIAAMERAGACLVGQHDFRAFRASDCQGVSTVRHLFRVALVQRYGDNPELLALEVEGTAFLKNMVRIIAGTLIDIGRGRLREQSIAELLASGDRTQAGITAPAHGLYLDEVFIRPEYRLPEDSLALRPAYADQVFDPPSPPPPTSLCPKV